MTEVGSQSPHQKLAHFELHEELGRGGMGVVYRARDVRLGRQVAIKLLPAALAGDPDRRSRFLREARAAAQLNHPNIATLYEYGEADWTPPAGEEGATEDSEPRKVIYLAMEYVDGQDLTPSLEGEGLSLGQTLDYGIQISEALAAAHAAGVIHRDLKPQNLRVTRDGRVKILDFGLAKMIQQGSVVEEPLLTAHGAIVGTAPYMAPEQLQGASDVDSRCDLFSLGVVLYQMLTGRLPFQAQRLVDYVKALTSQTPEPPSHSNPEVSPQLERVVERLLAKEPADRYDSALRVGEDLKSIARGQKIEPPPSRTRAGDSLFGEVLQPFRRPWVGWLVGAVFLAALLGVWWSSSQPATGESETSLSETPIKMVHLPVFENVSGEAEKDQVCRGIGLALENAFQEVPVIVVRKEADAENLDAPMRLEGACQSMGEEVSILLRLIDRSSGVMVWSRVLEETPDRVVPEMAWAVAEALDVAVLPEVRERLDRTPARSVTALTHYFRGLERQNRFDDEAALEEAVTQFREALWLEPDFALAHVGLSEVLRQLALKTNRSDLAADAKEEIARALELAPNLFSARRVRAKLFRDQGDFDSALADLQSLLAAQPRNPDLHLQLAEVRFRKGEVEQAIETLEQGLQTLSVAPRSSWHYWNKLGWYLLEAGDYEAASGAFLRASDIAPAGIFVPIENMISVELYRDRPQEALRWFHELPEEHRSLGTALNLGNTYYQLGDYAAARDLYTEAIRLAPGEPMGYASRGDTYSTQGLEKEAQDDYRQAARKIAAKIALDPSSLHLRSRELVYLAKAGLCEDALSRGRDLEASMSSTPSHLLRIAQWYALCGPQQRAADFLQQAIEAGIPRGRACQEPELKPLCAVAG